jgi:putative DNA primase/helicase
MSAASLGEIAYALGGEISGDQVICPGPGHSRTDRSLAVSLTPGGDFLAHSFCGDDWRDCRDHVKARLGIAQFGPSARESKHTHTPEDDSAGCPIVHGSDASQSDDNRYALATAKRIASEIRPLLGTEMEQYLREKRRIDTRAIEDVLGRFDAVGWHGSVHFNELGHALHRKRLNCIVAIMSDPISAEPTGAISRTYIASDLTKIGKAKTLGSPAGVVRLSRDEDVLGGLFLSEGLETGLAAMSIGLCPLWAKGSATTLAKFPIIDGIECINIVCDCDANGAGESAAREAERRWRNAGREIRILRPDLPGDLNDALMGLGR